MYFILFVFLVLFPFLIFPWPPDYYYSEPKALYLILFTFINWLIYLFLIIKGAYKTKLRKIDFVIISFFFLVSLSTYFSTDVTRSLTGTVYRYEGAFAWFSYISFFYFASRFIPISKRNHVYLGLSISSSLVAIYAILQHFLLDFFPRHLDKLTWTRSYAFFDNPNFYGTYAVVMMLILMAAFLEEKNRRFIVLYYVTIGLLFISMLYSLTRSAWLGSFVGFLLLTFVVIKRKELWKKWGLLSIGLATLFIAVNVTEASSMSQRANSIVVETEKTISGDRHAGSNRLYIWRTALPLVAEYPLLGSGPDTFGIVFPHNEEEAKLYFGNGHIKVDKAHNEYLQIAVTLGLPALFLYLFIVSFILWRIFKTATQTDNLHLQIVGYGLAAVIIGYLVQAFFNISVISVAPYFWVFLGIAYRYSEDF